ncbi:MAG: radical SAM family RiPP maturation amino acid epimerase [Desulfatitalea sp.]|nr:radical SAM family RiPP maturation amino acid epimerase [Desulfatitalea sp.]NNK02465.1 radical SAM family RiPP maturation amino acid epimerase [Desulfatitalea sp.]
MNSFSEKDLCLIAQMKRFFECTEADRSFANALNDDSGKHDVRKRMRDIGIAFEPQALAPLWKQPDKASRYWDWVFDGKDTLKIDGDLEADLKTHPMLHLWAAWLRARTQMVNTNASDVPDTEMIRRFHAWRQRRIAATQSELGHYADQIDHPIFAFELSKGCSMSCAFCGFSSEKLSAVFDDTPENRRLWSQIVRDGYAMFGDAACGALCYYATEPYDNAHYLDFIKDYKMITGAVVCTATAAPLHDPAWLRRLIRFYREGPDPWPRISVLSLPILRKIHDTYSPDELRDVTLLLQMKNAPRMKAKSGRTRHYKNEHLGGLKIPKGAAFIPQGSIACVSGFLVNMVDKTIKLVSPCYASNQWPHGYREFAKTTFEDAKSYRAAIEKMVETHMPENPLPDSRLAFRDDLRFENQPNGFLLLSPNKKHHIGGHPVFKEIGAIVDKGTYSYRQVMESLLKNDTSMVDIDLSLKMLYDKGLLDETNTAR